MAADDLNEQSVDPLIGSKIDDKFLVLEFLGRGTHGAVYKVEHTLLSQHFALKLLNQHLMDSALSLQRFKNEATLLSSFEHQNIVKFQSFGNVDDQFYMSLEFIEGKTLASIISAESALKEERLLPLAIDICEGLSYAHDRGIVHRDLKPSNIMVTRDDEVGSTKEHAKIIDFGIFKSLDSSNQKLTKTGVIIGSVNYMSPEQCKASQLDLRTDIYSLSCLLYEALSGKAPMEGDNELLTMSNHLNKVIANVPAKNGISKVLEAAIVKGLQKDPEQRFASAKEFCAELRKANENPQIIKAKINIFKTVVSILVVFILAAAVCIGLMQSIKSKTVTALTKTSAEKNKAFLLDPEATSNLAETFDAYQDWLKANNQSLRYDDVSDVIYLEAKLRAELNLKAKSNIQYSIYLLPTLERLKDAGAVLNRESHLEEEPFDRFAKLRRHWLELVFCKPMKFEEVEKIKSTAGSDLPQFSKLNKLADNHQRSLLGTHIAHAFQKVAAFELASRSYGEARSSTLLATKQLDKLDSSIGAVPSLRIVNQFTLGKIEYSLRDFVSGQNTLKTAALQMANYFENGRIPDPKVSLNSLRILNDFGITRTKLHSILERDYNKIYNNNGIATAILRECARAHIINRRFDSIASCFEKAFKLLGPNYGEEYATIATVYVQYLKHAQRKDQIPAYLRSYINTIKSDKSISNISPETRCVKGLIPISAALRRSRVSGYECWEILENELNLLIKKHPNKESIDGAELAYQLGFEYLTQEKELSAKADTNTRKAKIEKARDFFNIANKLIGKANTANSVRATGLRLANYTNLMVVYGKLNDYDKVESIHNESQDIIKSVELCPLGPAYFNDDTYYDIIRKKDLAKSIAGHEKHMEQMTWLNAPLNIDSHYAKCALSLAEEYFEQGNRAKAIDALERGATTMYLSKPYDFKTRLQFLNKLVTLQKRNDSATEFTDWYKQFAEANKQNKSMDRVEIGRMEDLFDLTR